MDCTSIYLTFRAGTGEPQPSPRLEFTEVDLLPGAADAFEAALGGARASLSGETLWYRMVVGGPSPRYIRLRPESGLAAVLRNSGDQKLPEAARRLTANMTIEVWTLRPTMSLGVEVLRH